MNSPSLEDENFMNELGRMLYEMVQFINEKDNSEDTEWSFSFTLSDGSFMQFSNIRDENQFNEHIAKKVSAFKPVPEEEEDDSEGSVDDRIKSIFE